MLPYDPEKVKVVIGCKECSPAELTEVKLPNITITDMSDYPKDHPDYSDELVGVGIRSVQADDGNNYSVSFKVAKGSKHHLEFASLDPYDTTSITVKVQ